ERREPQRGGVVAAGPGVVARVRVVPLRAGAADGPGAERRLVRVPHQPLAGAGEGDDAVPQHPLGDEAAGAVHPETVAERRAGAQAQQDVGLRGGGGGERGGGEERGRERGGKDGSGHGDPSWWRGGGAGNAAGRARTPLTRPECSRYAARRSTAAERPPPAPPAAPASRA